MEFKDTCLYSVLMDPINYGMKNSLYHCILRLPYFVLVYTVGILMAICVDFYVAMTTA